MDNNTDFELDNNLVEELSRCNTPLGVKPIFEFSDVNQNIPSICDFPLDDFGRESLGIINLDNIDVGRESLWIANLKSSEIMGDNISQKKRTDLMDNNDSGILNTAFLKPTKDSARSSTSSCDSIYLSPNLLNINNNISSRLVSYSESNILKSDFIESVNMRPSLSPIYLNLNGKLNNVNQLHQSDPLSPMLEDIMNIQICHHKHKGENGEIWSPIRPKEKFKSESNEGFNDSVFIEANHLAARIEDGSIYDLGLRENDMLDSIQEPEDLVNLSVDNGESVTYGTTAVFKMVDKILPSSLNHDLPLAISSEQNNSNDISRINESKNISKDKDPKNILSTLSEILNNHNLISEKQKYEGQNMISNLAAILISNGNSKIHQLDDSGHSSIENDPGVTSPTYEYYEVLDLRKRKLPETTKTVHHEAESTNNCYPLDLSLKSKSFVSEKVGTSLKILPFKYNNNQSKTLLKENNINGNYLLTTNQNNNLDDIKNKFKLKKIEEKTNLRKGPMKAMVPVDNMARRKSGGSKLHTTPKRSEVQLSGGQKKLGTPVNGLILKPVAQSTPEGVSSNLSTLNKLSSPPAAQGRKVVKQKLSYSKSSLHSISNKNQDFNSKKTSFIRRHSVDDIKKSQEAEKKISIRSSSVGRNSRLSSVASVVEQNVSTVKQNSRTKIGNLPVLKENRSKSVTRSSFGRRNGKENLC